MAENLKKYGWEYIVIDAGWYAPGMETLEQYESVNATSNHRQIRTPHRRYGKIPICKKTEKG